MRASRLLSVLLLLQTRGRMTAQQLADELEVSVRTVYRDMESLAAAGVPLYGDPGHDGGYRLVDGYRTRLTGLTREEAEALSLAGLPGPAADLGFGTVLATAQLKLMAALPDELRDRTDDIRQRFHLDTSGWYAETDPIPHLAAVTDAVWRQHRIRVRYRRWKAPQEVTRTLEPYGLVLKSGRWYLVAGRPEPVRTYRVSQILRIQVLQDHFERPPGFDLAAHWHSYLADFDARRHQGDAVVRLSPQILKQLPDLMEPAVARAARDSAGPPGPDGRVQVVIPTESVEHAVGMLLRLGAEAEVVAPTELRAQMAQTIATLADTYRHPPTPV
ncbi:helix-turn-helix transcriptional regulator [Streptomyces caelestis]|uniref:Putative DNA-binding transcriptional regulator YafY n=1 Tax=Streptomyces caelestis TaxID=36816 RepID=A0A7W9H516_9ACTN|nr:YafY family protein [Streptomyces caelestis]MBB5795720.1 putative DNA-binding transcriptional regulator YafY [Streptomyces caelestis]GGW61934.1 transcriptional regulator [Streptomyces caelestis]